MSESAAGRAGLEAAIAANRSLELVGRSSSLENLARDINDVEPEVVLIQAGPHDDVFAELRSLSGNDGESRIPFVIVLPDAMQIPSLAEAVRAGITALLPREATVSEISAAIEAAAVGLFTLHPAFVELLPETQPSAPAPARAAGPSLTPREVEVLNLMAQGLGNKEIAWKLGISEHTVKFHIGSIFNKLDASGRTEAVTLGIRAGLIML